MPLAPLDLKVRSKLTLLLTVPCIILPCYTSSAYLILQMPHVDNHVWLSQTTALFANVIIVDGGHVDADSFLVACNAVLPVYDVIFSPGMSIIDFINTDRFRCKYMNGVFVLLCCTFCV